MAGITTLSGYGNQHQKLRAAWRPYVEAGEVDCARCGKPITPGTPWDLGHDDQDRSRYSGPEHATCNRATRSADRASDPDPTPRTRWE
jgi:hypothetical protein